MPDLYSFLGMPSPTPSASQTENGKAFEYACLLALKNALQGKTVVLVPSSPQLSTAVAFYNGIKPDLRINLDLAAKAAAKTLISMEPNLSYGLNPQEPVYLSLQADSAGTKGDVRDVVCVRQGRWNVGISCKHDHGAVKHSRLSKTINFGKEWLGLGCSQQYFDEIDPIFDKLISIRGNFVKNDPLCPKFEDIPNKEDDIYYPILIAFKKELLRLDASQRASSSDPNLVPRELIKYLFGRNDFYKVTSDDKDKLTTIRAINLYGTLGKSSADGHKGICGIPQIPLPTKFLSINFFENRKNTLEVTLDHGWALTLRIHNASKEVESSLKFDVQAESYSSAGFVQTIPW